MDRKYRLKQMHHCLNTPEGRILMEEMEKLLDGADLFHTDPLEMAKRCAERDVYKLLESLERGDGLNG
jgi:hypothetical protein